METWQELKAKFKKMNHDDYPNDFYRGLLDKINGLDRDPKLLDIKYTCAVTSFFLRGDLCEADEKARALRAKDPTAIIVFDAKPVNQTYVVYYLPMIRLASCFFN